MTEVVGRGGNDAKGGGPKTVDPITGSQSHNSFKQLHLPPHMKLLSLFYL